MEDKTNIETLLSWTELISFVLAVAAFIMLILAVRATIKELTKRKVQPEPEEKFGEDVPPVIVAGNTVRPQPLPSSFGRSPGRE